MVRSFLLAHLKATMTGQINVKVRGVIVLEGKIFLCKPTGYDFYCLPGGRMEAGETSKETLHREIIEELGVVPEIWALLFTHEFVWWDTNEHTTIDLRYAIHNGHDFVNVDISQASHGFEHTDVGFYDLATFSETYLPKFLDTFLSDYLAGKQTLRVE